jgi:hypothetical protein
MRTFEATRSGRVPGSMQGPRLNMAHPQKVTVVGRTGSDRALASSFSGMHLGRDRTNGNSRSWPSHSSRAVGAHPRTASHQASNPPLAGPCPPRPLAPFPKHSKHHQIRHPRHRFSEHRVYTIDLALLFSHTTSVLISLVSPNVPPPPRPSNAAPYSILSHPSSASLSVCILDGPTTETTSPAR